MSRTRAIYNKHGKLIMGAAAYHAGIYDMGELARRTLIPYASINNWLTKDFGAIKFSNLARITRAAGMTEDEIMELFKERG